MNSPLRLVSLVAPSILLAGLLPFGGCESQSPKDLAEEIRETRPVGGEPIIPLDALPGAGGCRIWYPGKSPHEQPSAGKCEELVKKVPPGAWLVYRPAQTPQFIQIREYPVQPEGVVVVRNYEAATGQLLEKQIAGPPPTPAPQGNR